MPGFKISIQCSQTKGSIAVKEIIAQELKKNNICISDKSDEETWGLIFTTKIQGYENEIIEQCVQMRESRRILILHVGQFKTPWENASPELKSYLNAFVKTYNILHIYKLIRDIVGSTCNSILPYQKEMCQRYFYAKKIYNALKNYGHGGQNDITNSYLGPVRMMLKSSQKIPEEIEPVIGFCSFIEETKECGHLGKRIKSAWDVIDKFHKMKTEGSDLIDAIEKLMNLLTECRSITGERPINEAVLPKTRKSVLPIPEKLDYKPGRTYRVLVVDDHAKYWRPVFKQVASILGSKDKNTIFHFSDDAATITGHAPEQLQLVNCLPDYDAILLDIYMPDPLESARKKDNGAEYKSRGLEILEEIRKRCGWIPVIIWTSSLSHELAAEASISNGYLFKKTATCADIVNTLDQWLASGASRRRMSLPNPFFDHTLQTDKIRQLAVDFTDWCLKHLDSFHALDDRYFKFFNDHGGRHITKVMDIVDKLVRPLIFTGSGIAAGRKSGGVLFSPDPEEREKEILYLYLAILCHELGMFPMQEGHGRKEDYSFFEKGDLNIRRQLHAIRSMLIIAHKDHQSPGFRELSKRLANLDKIGPHYVAVLAGYHSKFLDISGRNFLGNPAEKWKKLNGMSDEDKSIYQNKSKSVFKKISELPKYNKERLRKLCAILRFADAIDIDKTRVPADFLLYHAARSSTQDVENLKRMVVEKIVVDRGTVFVHFNAAITEETRCPFKPKQISALQDTRAYTYVDEKKSEKISAKLKQYFHDRDQGTYEMAYDYAKYLAALAVLYEIKEEYYAIKASGLVPNIKLGSVSWGKKAEKKPNPFFKSIAHKNYRFNVSNDYLTKDDKSLITLAFDNLLREAWLHVGNTEKLKLKVVQINSGKSGAKTFLIYCEPYQPRFCKIDDFEKIEREYKGLKNIASLHIPARNLVGDVHISKYIDKGLLMGSCLLDRNREDLDKGFLLLEDYLIKNSGNIDANEIFQQIFSDIANEGHQIAIKKGHVLYEQEIDKINNALKNKAPNRFVKLKPEVKACLDNSLQEQWCKIYLDLWDRFLKQLKARKLTRAFAHGDLQPLNILIEPGRSDSSRFILIDTASCAYNHCYRDAAVFDMYLKTTFIRKLGNNDKSYKDAAKISKMLRTFLKLYAVKKGEEENTEFAIACLMRHFLFLLFWLDEVDNIQLAPMIYDVWDELFEMLKQIDKDTESVKEFMACLKKACNPVSTVA